MPVGAFGGKREFMEMVSPSGPVYQAGTLSGNPVAMAAGLANLELITRDGFFEKLAAKTGMLVEGIQLAADQAGIPFRTTRVGGMFGLFFTDAEKVVNFAEAGRCDVDAFKLFYHMMLERGVYLAPSAFEAGFVSSAHTDEQIEATIAAAAESFSRL
jgi:glutamate-1-semialdehyde 2,1-aminomutase